MTPTGQKIVQPISLRIMKRFAKASRSLSKMIFRLRNRATILDIPTDRFNDIIKNLRSDGWKKTSEYSGFDAWIDYGSVGLKKNGVRLFFEWDNWTEGSIEGPRDFIEDFAKKNAMSVSYEWRWSEYDNNF